MRNVYAGLMLLSGLLAIVCGPIAFVGTSLFALGGFTSGVVIFLVAKIADDCRVIKDRLHDRNLTVMRTPGRPGQFD